MLGDPLLESPIW